MVRRTRQIRVDSDVFNGLLNLKRRYNRPVCDIAKTIFDQSDLEKLDEILGYKRRRGDKNL